MSEDKSSRAIATLAEKRNAEKNQICENKLQSAVSSLLSPLQPVLPYLTPQRLSVNAEG